jgi:D-alanine-D-alanine ligase-like ATP-grasp enzyme
MTETSLLPKSAAAAGIPFGELCKMIAEASLSLRS